ncbi:MAG: hypothetical protein E7629_08445 [Ruminococcaceae bacterium]|nr:hypothetical protein [Oscillospiraceae bacterium]
MEEQQQNLIDKERARMESVRNFLCSYQLCADMLHLKRYERKRAYQFDDEFDCEDILAGNEAYWRARMYAVGSLIEKMKNGREKLMIYYHYVRGESIEHAANLLDVSRRTGYRLHERGLRSVSFLYERMKKENPFLRDSLQK